jgi:phosphoglycolate phosphatase
LLIVLTLSQSLARKLVVILAKKTISTIFFDLDGTLIDHFKAIHRCYNQILGEFGCKNQSMLSLKKFGGPLPTVVEELLQTSDPVVINDFCRRYRALMERTFEEGLEELPGARWLLQSLSSGGYELILLTNKQIKAVTKICNHLHFTSFFREIIAVDESVNCFHKPQPEFCQRAFQRTGVDGTSSMLIGDSEIDWQTSQNGHFAQGFWVTTGTHSQVELEACGVPPGCIFPSLHSLGESVFGFNS